MWKTIVPIGMVAVILAVFFFAKGMNKSTPDNLSGQPQTPTKQQAADVPDQKITSENADQSLDQTDKTIQISMDALDKDLQNVDQNDSSQDNENNP